MTVASDGGSSPPIGWSDWLLAALLLGGALYFRVPALGASSLWLDDAWLGLVYRADNTLSVFRVGLTSPGFALLLRFWFGLLGFSSLTAQLLPFLFGVITPSALYFLARRVGIGAGSSLIGGAILVLSPVHILYSVRVKAYSLEALAAVVILWVGWAVVEGPLYQRRWYALLGVSVVATALSALVIPVIIGAFIAALLAWLRHPAREAVSTQSRPLLMTAAFAVFGLAWYAMVLKPVLTEILSDYWSGGYITSAGDLGEALIGISVGLFPIAGWLGAALMVAALSALVLRRRELAVLVIVPVVVLLVLGVAQRMPVGAGRTEMFLYPAVALMVAGGFGQIPQPTLRRGSSLVLVAVLALSAPARASYPQENVRPLVEIVDGRMQQGDGLLIYHATGYGYGLYTDHEISLQPTIRMASQFVVQVDAPQVDVLPVVREQTLHRLEGPTGEMAAERERIWLLYSHLTPLTAVAMDRVRSVLEQRGFHLAQTWDRQGAELQLWSAGPKPS